MEPVLCGLRRHKTCGSSGWQKESETFGNNPDIAAVGKLQGEPDFPFGVYFLDGDGTTFVLERRIFALAHGGDTMA